MGLFTDAERQKWRAYTTGFKCGWSCDTHKAEKAAHDTKESARIAAVRKQRTIDCDMTLLRKSIEHYIPERYRKLYDVDQAIDLLQTMIDNAINCEEQEKNNAVQKKG